MVYITYLIVKAQINYMFFFKNSKMSEILCVNTFDIICIFNLIQCVHHTMEIFKYSVSLLLKNSIQHSHFHNIFSLYFDFFPSKFVINLMHRP
jgi:hypothetical protein